MRIDFRPVAEIDLANAIDAYTREPIGVAPAVVCDACQNIWHLSTYQRISQEQGQVGCLQCGHARLRHVQTAAGVAIPPVRVPPVRITGLRLEYVAVVSNVARLLRDGIRSPGDSVEFQADTLGNDPIPHLGSMSAVTHAPDGTYLGDFVAPFLNARNNRIYGHAQRNLRDGTTRDAMRATCILRLDPCVRSLPGAWITDGYFGSCWTKIRPGSTEIDASVMSEIEAESWFSAEMPDQERWRRKSRVQAVLLVPSEIPANRILEIVVPNRVVADLVTRAIVGGRYDTLPLLRIDPSRFFMNLLGRPEHWSEVRSLAG